MMSQVFAEFDSVPLFSSGGRTGSGNPTAEGGTSE